MEFRMNHHNEVSYPFDFVYILRFINAQGLDRHTLFIVNSPPDVTETARGDGKLAG